MLYGLQERNSKAKTWVYHVKRLLCVKGFGYVWMYGEAGDEKRFLHIFKERLKGCFYQRWWTHISNSERFDLYHCFQSTLQCERDPGCMQSRIYKTALAQFRFGVSRINCYRLSFSAAFDLRNCPSCTTSTEDECHMLFQCQAYTDLRFLFYFEKTFYDVYWQCLFLSPRKCAGNVYFCCPRRCVLAMFISVTQGDVCWQHLFLSPRKMCAGNVYFCHPGRCLLTLSV